MVMFSVICFVSFHTFLENLSFPSAFIVRPNGFGGSGGGPGASTWAFGGQAAGSNCYGSVVSLGSITY